MVRYLLDHKILLPSSLVLGLVVIIFGTFTPYHPEDLLSKDWFTIGIKFNGDCPDPFYKVDGLCKLKYDISSIPDSVIITGVKPQV